MKRTLFLLLVFAASGWVASLAQSTAIATVEVRDPSAAMVPGAEVTIAMSGSPKTKTGLRTDSNGTASFDLLPGTYDLSVKMAGFRDLSRQVVITDAKRQTLSVVLQLGVCSPCVEVTGTAASETYRLNYSEFLRMNGVIFDAETATAVALAIFRPVFGKEYTDRFVPYQTRFNDGVWTVYGTLPQGSRGGAPMLKIQKSDGKVLEVWLSQ
jgi:hypothetical protein